MDNERTQRLDLLRHAAGLTAGEVLLVSHLPDIRWATGFTGSNGCLLIAGDRSLLLTDGRYKEQVQLECPMLDVHIVSGPLFKAAGTLIAEENYAGVYVQKSRVTWESVDQLRSSLENDTLVAGRDPVPELRASKSPSELVAIKKALNVTEQVFEGVLSELKEGVSEQDIAAEIDYRHRQMGASRPAFDTIVAFSDHAALPHARPGTRKLKRGDVVLMDFGGVMDGYHSDMTRTVSFGRADTFFLEAYESVRDALLKAQEKARAGMTGEELDGIARQVLTDHGLGSAFGHSLGHGVGLEIHEGPSVSSRNHNTLPSGCIITLEPGVYLPGEFGIRIENMARLDDTGCTVLNTTGTELIRL